MIVLYAEVAAVSEPIPDDDFRLFIVGSAAPSYFNKGHNVLTAPEGVTARHERKVTIIGEQCAKVLVVVVSNSYQICGQTMTKAVPTALRQSGQSVFLSHPDRLSSQVMPVARDASWNITSPGPVAAPPPCVRAHLPAGLACHHWGCPPASFSHVTVATQGVDLVSRCAWASAASDTLHRKRDVHSPRR